MALNKEALKIATSKLVEAIKLPDYYMDYVDESINLERHNRDCCPLHDEDSPSFFYFEDSERFHCFGCDKSGSVVDLHYYLLTREDPSITKVKAVLDLSSKYQVKIPNLFKEVSIEDKNNLPRYEKLKFKTKENLVKPLKKVESDFEIKLVKLKERLSIKEFRFFINEWDRILFKNVDVENRIKELENELNKQLKRKEDSLE